MKAGLLLLSLTFACGIPVHRQDKKPDANKEDPKAQALRRVLDSSLETKDFLVPMTFKEFLGLLGDKMKARKEALPVVVDAKAFQQKKLNVYNAMLRPLPEEGPKELPVGLVLGLMVNQIPGGASWSVRDGRIEIAPKNAADKK